MSVTPTPPNLPANPASSPEEDRGVAPIPAVQFVPVSSISGQPVTVTDQAVSKTQLTSVAATVITSQEFELLHRKKEEERVDKQELVRASITICFLLLWLILIIFSCFMARSWFDHWQQTKEMLQIILPALTGLLGSSLGFYFGSRDRSSGTNAPAK